MLVHTLKNSTKVYRIKSQKLMNFYVKLTFIIYDLKKTLKYNPTLIMYLTCYMLSKYTWDTT